MPLPPDVAATREVVAVQVVSVQVVSVPLVPLQAAPVREEVRRVFCGLVNAACSAPRFASVLQAILPSCRRTCVACCLLIVVVVVAVAVVESSYCRL